MQTSLWKLGALLGVIGVGFLVLLKAQSEMTDGQQPGESFSELAAIEELEDLGSDQAAPPDSDGETAEAAEKRSLPVAVAASTVAEPQPTPAVAATPASGAAVTASTDQTESINPFADFDAAPAPADQAEPTPSGWEGADSAEALADEETSDPVDEVPTTIEPADSLNPFGALVDSFSRRSSSQSRPSAPAAADADAPILPVLADASPQAALEEPVPAPVEEETAGPQLAAAGAFDPFTPAESPQTSPEEPVDVEAAPADAAGVDEAPQIEAAPSDADPADDGATATFARTSLTALPPADAGPLLMAPPAEPEVASPSQVEPAAFSAEADAGDDQTQIAQVSGEQPSGGAEPNPFLVFPGADEPAPRQPARTASDQQQGLPAAPAAAPMFPSDQSSSQQPPSTGRAWVGDTPRIEVPPQIEPGPRGEQFPAPAAERRPAADNRVVLPDGTVEMTIMPRNGEPQTARVRQDQQGSLNPFAPGPLADPSTPAHSGREPAPFAVPPAEPATPQGNSGDPGLSFSKGPIQPSAAELPLAGTPDDGNGLTSADFIGVGTISPDTPSTPQQAQLTIEKQAPADAALGQELIYSILVRNIGRSDAKNVVVEDLVPKGTELQGTDPQAHMTPDKKLVWKFGTMNPGTSQTIRIKVIPREAGQIGSVATVSFEAAVASRTVITAPQLRLALSGPDEVRVGEKAPYIFTLTNSGSADASNVYIRNIIPAGFEHPAAQKRNGVTDIEYEVGTLRRGESREVELTLLAVEEGQFQNHAILSADGNVNVEAEQPVQIIGSRLKIHREGPANRVVGSQARFTNTVTNESARPLQGVTVTETIPPGLKFIQASDGGRFDPQQRQVNWQIDTLEPGGARQLQTVLLAEQGGELASTITAADHQGDQAQASSRLNVAGYSSLTVDVTNPARAIPVGEEVALRLKVRNGGSAAANGVETRIKLPPELKFVSARGPVRYAQQGEWIAFEPIDRIDVQGEQTFDIVLAGTAESQDARIVVQLTSAELSKPLSEDESVVIYAE